MKILSLIFLAFLTFSCSNKKGDNIVIGHIANNKYVITTDLESLQKIFDNDLIDQAALLDSFSIKKDYVEGTKNQAYYYLKGNNKSNTVKVARELTLKDGKFYLIK